MLFIPHIITFKFLSDNHIEIVETWKDDASLKKHSESEHFRRLVPQLEECGTLTLERFDF